MHGFPCTHLHVVSLQDSDEIWVSRSVPGYQYMNSLMDKTQEGTGDLDRAVKQAGYDGFRVKIVCKNNNESSTIELVKVDYTIVPESMLEIPQGYTETKGNPFTMDFHNETKINEQFKADKKIGK